MMKKMERVFVSPKNRYSRALTRTISRSKAQKGISMEFTKDTSSTASVRAMGHLSGTMERYSRETGTRVPKMGSEYGGHPKGIPMKGSGSITGNMGRAGTNTRTAHMLVSFKTS